MKILAIDPATKCGWAHSDGASGVWNCAPLRDESAGMRLIRFRSKLREILEGAGIDLVVFEAARNVFHQGALVVQSELQGVLKLFCEENKINYRGFSPSEIKKHATGKGNAGKEQMLSAARLKFSKIKILDDNHADALWLLDLASKLYGT